MTVEKTMNFKRENLELLTCIMKKDRKAIKGYLGRHDIADTNFQKFVRVNGLSGYVYSLLEECHCTDLFATEFIDHVNTYYNIQRTKNIKLLTELEKLRNSFVASETKVIFLKGHFFALRFYKDIGQRCIADIDLLVRENEQALHQANEILGSEGYARESRQLLGRKIATHFTHHFEYFNGNVKLDLHWVLQSHFSFRLDYDQVWQRKQTFSFKGNSFDILSDEDELLFQILSIFMDTQLGTIRLKSFVDVYMLLRQLEANVNWEEFFMTRKKEHLFAISINILDLVLSLLNCRDKFKNLGMVLERNKKHVRCHNLNDKLKLLQGSKFSVYNKTWAFPLYESAIFKSFSWWLLSIPVKLAVYRESTSILLRGHPHRKT